MVKKNVFCILFDDAYFEMKNMCMCNCCRPQEGFLGYRGTFSVMESRILWWLESSEDVFYPSPGDVRFPLVREEDLMT